MGVLRKIVSGLVMLVAVLALVGAFAGNTSAFRPLVDSFSPFDARAFGVAFHGLVVGFLGVPFVLLMLGFIGLTMPEPK